MSITALMGLLYGLSELGLSLARRTKQSGGVSDGGSLRLIWITVLCSMLLASLAAAKFSQAQFATDGGVYAFGVGIYAAGLLLRWTSIIWLGKYFTVDVAIASDQLVVDTGPYRFVRHPSYTGALAAFLGFGICIGNWLALLLLLIPITWVFLRRIQIEEAVLRKALGEPYIEYSQRTKRLLPFLY